MNVTTIKKGKKYFSDCRPDGINVCKNGGTCNYSNTDMKMFCECPKGYSGELCEGKKIWALH